MKGTNAPFGALAFIHVKIDAGKLGPQWPIIPEIRVDRNSEGYRTGVYEYRID
jgi:hypothetical protein